jgi:hypothetical protein
VIVKKEERKVEDEPEFDDWEQAIDVVADAIIQTTKHAAEANQPEENDSEEETKHEATVTATAVAKGGKKKADKNEEKKDVGGATAFDNI